MRSFISKMVNDDPGRRFVRAHARAQRWSLLRRMAVSVIGVGCIVAGLVMLVAPGPGLVAIAVGLGLIGLSAHPIARLLDHGERVGRRTHKKMSPRMRKITAVSVMICAATAAGVMMYVTWQLT